MESPMKDFMKNAKPDNFFKEVNQECIKYFNSEEYKRKDRKRMQDIVELLPQVVGAERELIVKKHLSAYLQ